MNNGDKDYRHLTLEELRAILATLEIDNDFIFMLIMSYEEICKRLIEILLGITIIKIVYQTQRRDKNYFLTKSVCFDVYVAGDDRVINIEMQASHYENLVLRVRYYKAMVDSTLLLKGDDYEDLKETYILFICKNDPLGRGLPVYTLRTKCDEAPDLLIADRCTTKIYNSAAWEKAQDEQLRGFLRYVFEYKPTTDFTKKLDKIIKEERQKEETMVKLRDFNMLEYDARREGVKEGMQKGMERGREEMKAQMQGEMDVLRKKVEELQSIIILNSHPQTR